MASVVLANIGTSDIQFEGNFLGGLQRSKGQEILKDLQDDFLLFRSVIKFPILEPIIEEIGKIDLLIIFATDQHQGKTDNKFWEKDTINIAKIIQTVIKQDEHLKDLVKNVEIIPITSPPNNYDSAFNDFQRIFKEDLLKIIKEHNLTKDSELFISLTGGTPACNIALMYSAIHENRLGFKQFVYICESENEDKVKYLELGKAIQKQQLIQLAEQFLSTYNYEGLLEFITKLLNHDNLLIDMLKVLHYRKNFRFTEADNLLRDTLRFTEGQSRKIFRQIREDISTVKVGIKQLEKDFTGERITPEIKKVIAELFWNASMCYETGHYVDFLGRFWRLQESLLRIIFEEHIKTHTSKRNWPKVRESIQSNKQLLSYLNKKGINLFKDFNRYTYYHVLKFLLGKNDIFIMWVEKGSFGENSKNIVELRNKCILGHEFEGVNREVIQKRWPGDILEETEKLLENYLAIKIETNKINEVHRWLINRIFESL